MNVSLFEACLVFGGFVLACFGYIWNRKWADDSQESEAAKLTFAEKWYRGATCATPLAAPTAATVSGDKVTHKVYWSLFGGLGEDLGILFGLGGAAGCVFGICSIFFGFQITNLADLKEKAHSALAAAKAEKLVVEQKLDATKEQVKAAQEQLKAEQKEVVAAKSVAQKEIDAAKNAVQKAVEVATTPKPAPPAVPFDDIRKNWKPDQYLELTKDSLKVLKLETGYTMFLNDGESLAWKQVPGAGRYSLKTLGWQKMPAQIQLYFSKSGNVNQPSMADSSIKELAAVAMPNSKE